MNPSWKKGRNECMRPANGGLLTDIDALCTYFGRDLIQVTSRQQIVVSVLLDGSCLTIHVDAVKAVGLLCLLGLGLGLSVGSLLLIRAYNRLWGSPGSHSYKERDEDRDQQGKDKVKPRPIMGQEESSPESFHHQDNSQVSSVAGKVKFPKFTQPSTLEWARRDARKKLRAKRKSLPLHDSSFTSRFKEQSEPLSSVLETKSATSGAYTFESVSLHSRSSSPPALPHWRSSTTTTSSSFADSSFNRGRSTVGNDATSTGLNGASLTGAKSLGDLDELYKVLRLSSDQRRSSLSSSSASRRSSASFEWDPLTDLMSSYDGGATLDDMENVQPKMKPGLYSSDEFMSYGQKTRTSTDTVSSNQQISDSSQDPTQRVRDQFSSIDSLIYRTPASITPCADSILRDLGTDSDSKSTADVSKLFTHPEESHPVAPHQYSSSLGASLHPATVAALDDTFTSLVDSGIGRSSDSNLSQSTNSLLTSPSSYLPEMVWVDSSPREGQRMFRSEEHDDSAMDFVLFVQQRCAQVDDPSSSSCLFKNLNQIQEKSRCRSVRRETNVLFGVVSLAYQRKLISLEDLPSAGVVKQLVGDILVRIGVNAESSWISSNVDMFFSQVACDFYPPLSGSLHLIAAALMHIKARQTSDLPELDSASLKHLLHFNPSRFVTQSELHLLGEALGVNVRIFNLSEMGNDDEHSIGDEDEERCSIRSSSSIDFVLLNEQYYSLIS